MRLGSAATVTGTDAVLPAETTLTVGRKSLSVHVHVLGIVEFLEVKWWRIRFLPCLMMLQGSNGRDGGNEGGGELGGRGEEGDVEDPFFHRIGLQLSP